MPRPDHLADYAIPPLNEVVLGVQFSQLVEYDFRFLYSLHERFCNEYPAVAHQPVLAPQFETFGGMGATLGPQIEFGPPPLNSRTWFISSSNDHLLQVQPDRFMLNWRATDFPNDSQYPHFEQILESFFRNLSIFSDTASIKLGSRLQISQAEVSYINLISVNSFDEIGEWLRGWSDIPKSNLESLTVGQAEIINSPESRPIARLHQQLQTVLWGEWGTNRGLHLNLTFRGKPLSTDIDALKNFLLLGRERIVSRFTELTTDTAHQSWGRLR